ncbi:MAG: metallophosphoesterase [Spirochaetaceae bacterium]|jgi:Icc-related predicted phosphoesterase|nr:metallophosphoesterase [Spirochaetaceae bacterium]
MKILCVSDQIDPLVYSNTAKERFADVDIVISAGDLPSEYLDFIVTILNKPTFFVFGNHNLEEFSRYHKAESSLRGGGSDSAYSEMQYSSGATYVGFKAIRAGKLLIAGASGSLRYNNGQSQYTEAQMKFRLIKLIPRLLYNRLRYGRYLDILVTHASPRDIHDKPDPCHLGFKCFRWFMHTFKPTYLIHGHIHLYDMQDIRVSTFEETTVINAYSHYILEF